MKIKNPRRAGIIAAAVAAAAAIGAYFAVGDGACVLVLAAYVVGTEGALTRWPLRWRALGVLALFVLLLAADLWFRGYRTAATTDPTWEVFSVGVVVGVWCAAVGSRR